MTSVAEPGSAAPSPEVSVLLPVYNGGPFIGHALDSVLAQTFSDFEVIVIDDGSTDETADELRKRANDPRIRITRHGQNQGLVASLNDGLAMCSGALVARLDADDSCLPDRLGAQVAAFRDDTKLVLCATDYERVTPDGVVSHRGQPPPTHAALAVALLTGNSHVPA
jgi:glycosyltransferase involved in cell wall biosynthesis